MRSANTRITTAGNLGVLFLHALQTRPIQRVDHRRAFRRDRGRAPGIPEKTHFAKYCLPYTPPYPARRIMSVIDNDRQNARSDEIDGVSRVTLTIEDLAVAELAGIEIAHDQRWNWTFQLMRKPGSEVDWRLIFRARSSLTEQLFFAPVERLAQIR